jgi:Flp pilus assembly protein TadD
MARHSLTREPRVCAACGAKNRHGWRKCQRCQSPLGVSTADAAPESEVATRRIGLLVPILAGAGVVAVSGFLWMHGSLRRPAASPLNGGSAHAVDATTIEGARIEDRPQQASQPVTAADFAGRATESFRNKDFASALTAFEAAVARRPDDPDALNNLAQTLVRLNRAPEAVPRFQLAVQLAPGKWAYRFNLARARGLCGDWPGAVEDYRAADRLFPDDHATLFNLALALRKAGRLAEAVPVLERVIALAPEDPSFVLTAARTYDELDRRSEAAATYRKFLDQAGTGADADRARGRLALLESTGGQQD